MTTTQFKHVTVRLPKNLDRWLRFEAAERDVSKSHLIREILSQAAGSRALTGVEAMQLDPNGDEQTQAGQEK